VSTITAPLTALPPKWRAIVYWSNFALGLLLGCVQVGFFAAEVPQPAWLRGILAAGSFLSAGFAAVAASNTVLAPAAVEDVPSE
jgi:hypothetical protein